MKKDTLPYAANKKTLGVPIFYFFKRPMRPKYKKHNRIGSLKVKK